jgi:hypothetical protein
MVTLLQPTDNYDIYRHNRTSAAKGRHLAKSLAGGYPLMKLKMAPPRITFPGEELVLDVDNQLDQILDANRMGLLKEKLGNWLSWQQPAIVQTIGPFDPDVWHRLGEMRRSVMDLCVDWLRSSSDDRIAIVLRNRNVRPAGIGQTDQRDPEAQEWFNLGEGRLAELNRISPPWYAGGFGHPDHVADFEYWSKMAQFSVGELTCLSVGIEPKEYPGKRLKELSKSSDRPKFWKPQQFILLRYEQLNRTFDRHGHDRSVSPNNFLDWVDQFEFPVHPEFLGLLRRFHGQRDEAKALINVRKTDRREVDSIAILFTAMAIDLLGYVPGAARSPIPKEIGEIVASLGMTITEETIRKYLRIGEDFISPEWKPEKR